MDPNALRDQLSKLHEELASVRQVDSRSNPLLVEVLKDIQRLLEANRASGTPSEPSPGELTLPERLEKIAVQFEADHPTLAASSRRLIDMLGQVGL
jgi:uncharacterized protein DUF4404